MALAQGLVKPHCCAPAKAAVFATGERGKLKLFVLGNTGEEADLILLKQKLIRAVLSRLDTPEPYWICNLN